MKIGFVMWINAIAGGVFVIYRHAQYLIEQGHDVQIIFLHDTNGIETTPFPDLNPTAKLFSDVMEAPEKYDVLIATFWPTFYYMFMLPSKHYMYFAQSDERRFFESRTDPNIPFVQKTYTQKGVGIITEARWIKNLLEKDFGAVVEYAPNGIDTKLFSPEIEPLSPRNEKVRVLIEGPGDVFFKRVGLTFKIVNKFKDIEVWFVTHDGVSKDEWKYDRIFKKVDFRVMPAIYRSCDILVKLSTVEGFFGPPLEMMACGGASLVSNVTGYDEYIINEENALVAEMDNEEQITIALQRLISDKVLREKLSANGIKKAKSMDWSTRCPLFEKAILNLMNKKLTVTIKDKTDILLTRTLMESIWTTQDLKKSILVIPEQK